MTKQIAWMTDIHLDFAKATFPQFCHFIKTSPADAFVISGDIYNGLPSGWELLKIMEKHAGRPIYFVMGNHDYYGTSILPTRMGISIACTQSKYLHYLPSEGVISLSEKTALIGVDGWADGRYGDFFSSPVDLNDYYYIRELTDLSQSDRFKQLNVLADNEASKARKFLMDAFQRFSQVVMVTHVPPFPEAALYRGKPTDLDYLPHYASKVMGDTLLDIMSQWPHRNLLVLCGHTHGKALYEPLPNLCIRTGAAEYGAPRIERVMGIP